MFGQRKILGAVAIVVTALAVAACNPSTPSPTPKPSPTPTPTSQGLTAPAPNCQPFNATNGVMAIPECGNPPKVEIGPRTFAVPATYGKDISQYQGVPNLGASTAAGLRFVVARSNEGSYNDPTYPADAANARNTPGLVFGSYDFGYDCNNPVWEADHYLAVAQPRSNELMVLDIEIDPCGLGNQAAWVNAFELEVKAHTGRMPMVYSYSSFFYNHGLAFDSTIGSARLWIASYTASEPSVGQWGLSPLWQYTDAQCAFGFCSDGDVFFGGDNAALLAWAGGTNVPVVNPPVVNPPTPVVTPPSSGCGVYIVRRGDTLSGIAARYHTTYQHLAAINGIRNPNLIFVGERISICGGGGTTSGGGGSAAGIYIVRRGDTLSGIAAHFGISLRTIERLNPQISNYNLIYVGERIHV